MKTATKLLTAAFGGCLVAASLFGGPEAAPDVAALVTSSMPFIGITPCRVADTRDPSQPAGYGPPPLAAGIPRSFIMTGRCGIPAGAQAVSLNVTVVNPTGVGYVLLYPAGQPQPGVSTLNFVSGQTVANAAIVPLGVSGQITVAAAVSATDLLIDVNGYFGPSAVDVGDTFLGVSAGNTGMSGLENTGIGYGALSQDTTGGDNTAVGAYALLNNTTGSDNTAVGTSALRANTTGNNNCALGTGALAFNTTGSDNVAVGAAALGSNVVGSSNTAVGSQALVSSTGSYNTALGALAGFYLTTGDNNVYLGSVGAASESATLRIGDPGLHTAFFLAGVFGVTPGVPGPQVVYVDSTSKVGTLPSSARFKERIRDMGDASSPILGLRPVTFRYKVRPGGPTQYGLIAEEVETVLPDLVVPDDAGEPQAVLYHELPAMLVNEWQKQQKELARQETAAGEVEQRLRESASEQSRAGFALEALLARLGELERGSSPGPAAP